MLSPSLPIPMPFGAVLADDGIWAQVLNRTRPPGRTSALFLDRDGVVVEETNYLHKISDIRLIPGSTEAIRHANRTGIAVVIITNQSGIGRGMFGWDAFAQVQNHILDELAAGDAFVNAVFACPHHRDAKPPFNFDNHPDRKPNPGMLHRAATLLAIDLAASWVAGDRAADLAAGKNAGLAGGVHLLSGHGSQAGERGLALRLAGDNFKVIKANLLCDTLNTLPLFTQPPESI
jgi:D-glycero-D-manno-heptose 1,7-bisphosphate phosphatase